MEYNTTPSTSVLDAENYSYKERQWRAPKLEEGEEVIFDEPGRILPGPKPGPGNGTDCRSHYFMVTRPKYGSFRLRVRHGGGEEFWDLDYSRRSIDALGILESDARYRLLWVLMDAHHDGERKGYREADALWRTAAKEKRIKTRKMPNRPDVKVWIEPAR